jgi:demethylphylloquinone reductase
LQRYSTSDNEDNIKEDCDIVVFGGGFGGLYTALAIHNLQQASDNNNNQKSKKFNIVLVEPTEQFVFLPLLYDLTVGTATEQEVCPTYSDIFQNTNIRHIRASLQSIDIVNDEDGTNQSIVASIRSIDGRIGIPNKLRMKAGIIAVGASPESIIASVPGAKQYVQPFYTANDAKQTRRLLNHFDKQHKTATASKTRPPRIAIIGGGCGGVELSASIQRRLPNAHVQLLCRGKPMANTRAEHLIDQALTKLGVIIEPCNVLSFDEAIDADNTNEELSLLPKIRIQRTRWGTSGDDTLMNVDELPWDAVLWTAGSLPADPVSTNGCDSLQKSKSGRIAIDPTLRCLLPNDENSSKKKPRLWALGDCAEIVSSSSNKIVPSLPKTAQVAMQQADTVAANVLTQLLQDEGILATTTQDAKIFQYQDLGSMLTLGGPNAAVLAPKDDTTYGPIFAPLLDIANTALGIADTVAVTLGRTTIVEQLGIPTQETLGLSLGSYGLGVPDAPKGTFAGTLAGAARRTIYAVRMPTNQQRAVSLLSASISTAAALLKENSDRRNNDQNNNNKK